MPIARIAAEMRDAYGDAHLLRTLLNPVAATVSISKRERATMRDYYCYELSTHGIARLRDGQPGGPPVGPPSPLPLPPPPPVHEPLLRDFLTWLAHDSGVEATAERNTSRSRGLTTSDIVLIYNGWRDERGFPAVKVRGFNEELAKHPLMICSINKTRWAVGPVRLVPPGAVNPTLAKRAATTTMSARAATTARTTPAMLAVQNTPAKRVATTARTIPALPAAKYTPAKRGTANQIANQATASRARSAEVDAASTTLDDWLERALEQTMVPGESPPRPHIMYSSGARRA